MKINHPSISTAQGNQLVSLYLQHPSHSCLKETIKSVMYWKAMHIPSSKTNLADLAKNKRHSQKYSHVLSKLVIMTPRRA